MSADRLLTFLHSLVEVRLAQRDGVFVAGHEERDELCVVILVSGTLCLDSLQISLMRVEIGVVACLECLHTTSHGRVLLRGTRHHQHH